MEAISPTGPEAPRDYTDDLKQEKDDLLMKIAKVDREIMVAESQIAKLKKKYVRFIRRIFLVFGSLYFINYYSLLLLRISARTGGNCKATHVRLQ